jgi:4-amino-4-deoxy-L-arabinose transferase-like glycosyltransferase
MTRPENNHPTSPARLPKTSPAAITRWLLPALLALAYVAQCAWFIRTQSLTYDEPVHIAEGLNAWRYGRFEQYNDHPPLARLWCSLPLLSQKWQIDIEQLPDSFHVTRIAPDPVSLAWRARAMNVLLGLLLAWLVWSVADRLFSRSAANFALALFAFSPSLIAHFSIAATDGAATLLIFAAAWALVQWRRHPTWKKTFGFGILLGLLLLAKFSTAPMFVLALLGMLILGPDKIILAPAKWNWSKTAVTLLLAVCVVWAGYFFHVSHLIVHDGTLTATFPNWDAPIVKAVHGGKNYSLLIPAGEYIEGFRELVRHNRQGQPAFFLGQISYHGGWKLYYPVVILLKWPTIVLILSSIGIVMGLRGLRRTEKVSTHVVSTDLWIMASFPAVYLAMAIFARFNLGDRHVLPLYPFAILFAAVVWETTRHKRFGAAFVILLAALNAADTLRYAPGYLSYFTPFVRPAESFRLLTDSNLDWGQGLLALRDYQREHPAERILLSYFGSVDPELYGIQSDFFSGQRRLSGTIVVSATNLSGQYLADPDRYRWLLEQKPAKILDHSLYIFQLKDGAAPPLTPGCARRS